MSDKNTHCRHCGCDLGRGYDTPIMCDQYCAAIRQADIDAVALANANAEIAELRADRNSLRSSFALAAARQKAYREEIAQLRIERDNAREMEDVHGDNWEAAQAEVERLRGERDELRAALTEIDRVLFPRRTGGLLPSADYVREIETLIELDEER